MRVHSSRTDWFRGSSVYLLAWIIFAVVWWGPFATRSLYWGHGITFYTSASELCNNGTLRVFLDHGVNGPLLLLCLLFVVLEWAVSRHFRAWLITVSLVLLGIPTAAFVGRCLSLCGSTCVRVGQPEPAIVILFAAVCVAGIALDIAVDASRRHCGATLSRLTSFGAGYSFGLVSVVVLIWWQYTDDAFCLGWRFLLFLFAGMDGEHWFYTFDFYAAPFGRAVLFVFMAGLAVLSWTIVVVRLFVGKGIGRSIRGLMLVTALLGVWMSLFASLPYAKEAGLRHRIQEALPHLSAGARWRQEVLAGKLKPVPQSVPPEFRPYALAAMGTRLPFPCAVQLDALYPSGDGSVIFALLFHPGHYLEHCPQEHDTYGSTGGDMVHDSRMPGVVELGDGWYLTADVQVKEKQTSPKP